MDKPDSQFRRRDTIVNMTVVKNAAGLAAFVSIPVGAVVADRLWMSGPDDADDAGGGELAMGGMMTAGAGAAAALTSELFLEPTRFRRLASVTHVYGAWALLGGTSAFFTGMIAANGQ